MGLDPLTVLVLVIFGFPPAVTHGAGVTGDDPDGPMEQIVTIARRADQPLEGLAASVAALSGEQLGLIGHTHVQESLNRLAGVNLQRADGQEYLPAIRSPVLTGAGACGAFLIAEDNIPLRASGLCNINELFEAHTEMAERIEVLRGPGTVLYGSNAVHGIVNVVTPAPGPGGSASLELGPDGFARGRLRAGHAGQRHRYGLAVTGTTYDGWRDDAYYDQQKLSLRHRYEHGDLRVSTGLTATNLNQETAGYVIGPDAYKDEELAAGNLNPEGFRDAQALRLWSRIETVSVGAGALTITPYLRYQDMRFMMHFLPGTPFEENSQRGLGLQSAYTLEPAPGVTLVWGLDAEIATSSLLQEQESPTVGSPFLEATIPVGRHYDYDVDVTQVGAFADLEKAIGDELTLGAGVRLETQNYDYTNKMNSGRLTEAGAECGFGGCRYSRPESRRDRFTNWSADLRLGYELTDDASLYGRASRAFRAPQATELYRLQREQTVADLDSENISSVEIGLKGGTDSLAYRVTAYWMAKDNFIFRDADFFNVSNGKTRHRGLELELQYRGNGGYFAALGASLARHTYEFDYETAGVNINGNDIDTAPRLFGNARFGWEGERLLIELELAAVGSYYLEPANAFEYDGHTLVSLRASHQLAERLMLYVRAVNLLDEAYAERADYTTFSEQRYFPGAPRGVFAELAFRW